MIKQIVGVSTSKKNNVYGTDANGIALLPNGKDIAAKLVAGAWANVIVRKQTKTRDANNNLVDIPVAEQTDVHVITAIFENQKAAIMAQVGDKMFDKLVDAQVNAITKKISVEDFDLDKALLTV